MSGVKAVSDELRIPSRIRSWALKEPRLARLLASEYGDALMKAYEDLDLSVLYRSETHGVGHIERTMMYGAMIAQDRKLDSEWTRLLLMCCAYHDTGRHNDSYDLDHGRLSAEKIGATYLKNEFSDLPLAQAAIHAHAIPDSEMDGVQNIYGEVDRDEYILLTSCLKDADNLDRVRIYDLDTRFLRFKETKKMVPMAYRLLEEHIKKTTILCYGDSNTYGYNPRNGLRYPDYLRWTEVLQKRLGPDYKVINAGLNGRTAASAFLGEEWRSGLYSLEPVLVGNCPVDILVIMLGTNDCSIELGLSAEEISGGMEMLVDRARDILMQEQGYEAEIILVAPPHVEATVYDGPLGENFNDRQLEVSAELPSHLEALAKRKGCRFINLDGKIRFWDLDSEHFRTFDGYKLAYMLIEMITGTYPPPKEDE